MSTAVEYKQVTKIYSNGRGIKNVNLAVPQGEIFGFLGPNGAGKTTAIRTLMDFMRPNSGQITVFGKDSVDDSVAVKSIIGYVPADRQLYPKWTGRQHLDFYQSLREASPLDVVKKLDLDLNVPVKHLSSGNKQKLSLTLALAGKPKLLVMDEPTSGLDPLLQQTIYEILHEYKADGGTVFLSSHNLPEVEKICDRVGIIKDGSIIADSTMQDLRDKSIHIVSVFTAKQINFKASKIKNIEISHQKNGHAILKVKGDLNPLLSFLAKQKVQDVEINHANLEDIFLEYYS